MRNPTRSPFSFGFTFHLFALPLRRGSTPAPSRCIIFEVIALLMNLASPIYLDYNGTTPVDPEVAQAIVPYLTEHFGNPSSTHGYGRPAHEAMDAARRSIGAFIGGSPDEIVFTAGGSESDNLAIQGVAMALRRRGNHIITQETEHPAVLKCCRYLESELGFKVTVLPVDRTGLVNPQDLAEALAPETVLVTIMHANNETGTIQPIADLSAIAHRHGVLFHTDAAQSAGKIRTNVDELGVDLLTVVGHKLYAPKGVGALYVRAGTPLDRVIHGASQERGHRAGTENVPYIVGLGVASRLAQEKLESDMPRIRQMRDRFHHRLGEQGWVLNGHPVQRLPNTLNLSKTGLDGELILARATSIAASTGAACHAGRTEPSSVLTSMGIPRDQALGAVRLSLGRWTTERQVDQAAAALVEATTLLSVR
jgi:cysteine desulfurase